MWLLRLLCICESAKLQQPKSMASRPVLVNDLNHEFEEIRWYEYADYSAQQEQEQQQLNADNNNLLQKLEEAEKDGEEENKFLRLLLAKQRPAVQVKVTNEVESAMMRAQSNRNGPNNDKADTRNAMPSANDSSLMSPSTLPILERHNFYSSSSSGIIAPIDGQQPIANDEQLLRLQDYNLLYNAEKQTYFQLHSLNQVQAEGVTAQQQSINRRLQQVVGNTLTAAFGLNAYNGQQAAVGMTTQTVRLYDAVSLRQSRFNPFHPTRIIIHGWLGNGQANIYSYLVPAYLSLDRGNYNVFTLDWGRGAIADYVTASYRVKPVGQVLAKFVDFLHEETGMRFEDLQLIGFSMGAHVAGLAGQHVQTGRVSIIRALDPALPFFRYAQEKERLTKDDADYVEVLHTSVGSYGFDRPLGHVDFYANWGSKQPGCFWHECSHWRAFALLAESLQAASDSSGSADFEAKGCQPAEWQQLTRHKYCPQPTGKHLHMGGDLAGLSMKQLGLREGVYYFETNAVPPYSVKEIP